jgi:hypothetical protein
VPAKLAVGQDVSVAVIDLDGQHLGQGGIELTGLVVDRHLFLVLGGVDLREREIIAHGLVQTFIFSPRVLL